MKALLLLVIALTIAVPAHALQRQQLRVDRPQKGPGAQVTFVRLIRGFVPHRMRATVLSDTRCNPDQQGVSHCLNRLRLANGRAITVVHNHRMMSMPCLSPGERVVLTP